MSSDIALCSIVPQTCTIKTSQPSCLSIGSRCLRKFILHRPRKFPECSSTLLWPLSRQTRHPRTTITRLVLISSHRKPPTGAKPKSQVSGWVAFLYVWCHSSFQNTIKTNYRVTWRFTIPSAVYNRTIYQCKVLLYFLRDSFDMRLILKEKVTVNFDLPHFDTKMLCIPPEREKFKQIKLCNF